MQKNDTYVSRRALLQTVSLIGASVATSSVVTASETDRSNRKEIVVGVTDDKSPDDIAVDLLGVELTADTRVLQTNESLGFMTLTVPTSTESDASTMAATIRENEGVRYVEDVTYYQPQGIISSTSVPSDPGFSDQYAPQLVNAPAAWDHVGFNTQSDVTIAVIDQGIDYNHLDLVSQFGGDKGHDFMTFKLSSAGGGLLSGINLLSSLNLSSGCSQTQQTGRDDDPFPEWTTEGAKVEVATSSGTQCVTTYESHGTHVAGIAAGTTNNNSGIAGVSNASLLSYRALNPAGGRSDDIAAAVQNAVDNGARLINMSLGGSQPTQVMKDAVSYARENGVLPICAAGNSGGSVSYPAAYDECIAVAAVDENKAPASFTSHGPEIDVAGPGVDVLSSIPDGIPDENGYLRYHGTSMASPAVCGVAALGLAANPEWDADTLATLLRETATPIDGVDTDYQGHGIPDAEALVDASE
ncbi:S8 family serine peptidase [Halocatena marina]|uniref:S8 family serine peptidase n=1 Tax=Halocatena marina TaxID=2934937 RepID=A0ABD5YR75_9EURY|nr:S8 family serine peptidase [Halocatena marina]